MTRKLFVAGQLLPALRVEGLHGLELVDREHVACLLSGSARTWWRQREQRRVEEVE